MPTSSVGVCHMTRWLFCPFLLSLLTLLSILPIKSAHHCHKEYPVSLFFIFLLSMPLSFRVMPRNCFIILQRQVLFLKELQGHLLKSLPPRVLGSWGEDSSKQWKQQIKLHRTHSLGTTRRQTTWHTASHLYVEKQAPNSSKVNFWNPSANTHAEKGLWKNAQGEERIEIKTPWKRKLTHVWKLWKKNLNNDEGNEFSGDVEFSK